MPDPVTKTHSQDPNERSGWGRPSNITNFGPWSLILPSTKIQMPRISSSLPRKLGCLKECFRCGFRTHGPSGVGTTSSNLSRRRPNQHRHNSHHMSAVPEPQVLFPSPAQLPHAQQWDQNHIRHSKVSWLAQWNTKVRDQSHRLWRGTCHLAGNQCLWRHSKNYSSPTRTNLMTPQCKTCVFHLISIKLKPFHLPLKIGSEVFKLRTSSRRERVHLKIPYSDIGLQKQSLLHEVILVSMFPILTIPGVSFCEMSSSVYKNNRQLCFTLCQWKLLTVSYLELIVL